MEDTDASPRYGIEKEVRGKNEPEGDVKQQSTSFQHYYENTSATERAVSPYAASDNEHNRCNNAVFTLKSEEDLPTEDIIRNGERQNSEDSIVCIERQLSSPDRVNGQNEGHRPLGSSTSQDAMRSGDDAEEGKRCTTDCSAAVNVPGVETYDSVHCQPTSRDVFVEDSPQQQRQEALKETSSGMTALRATEGASSEITAMWQTHREQNEGGVQNKDSAENEDENMRTNTSRYTNALHEGTEGQVTQEVEFHDDCRTVTCQEGMQAGNDGKEIFPFFERRTPSNTLPTVTQESAGWQESDCSGAAFGSVSPPLIRRSHQRSEEDFHRLITEANNLEAKRSYESFQYLTSGENVHFATESTPSLEKRLLSVQQSNPSFRRTPLIRSVRNTFTEVSEWPHFARLLQLSQRELERDGLDVSDVTSHRSDFPRFADKLFSEVEKNAIQLFPLALFVEAARLPKTEVINGEVFKYPSKLLEFRDAMLSEFLNVQRAYHNGLCENLPLNNVSPPLSQQRLHQVRYLYEAEKAALQALKPLTECILTLEALMISEKREALLAAPQNANQRKCTVKYLKAFCASVTSLSKIVLPYDVAEAYHLTELFVVASAIRWKEKTNSEAERKCYATADREKSTQANFFGIDYHMHLALTTVSEEQVTCYALTEKALAASHKLIYRFKELRDFLWTRRKCLDHLDPHMDKDAGMVQVLKRFEVACRQFRRLILRPENLV